MGARMDIPKPQTIPEDQLHPVDDAAEVGQLNTAGYLYDQLRNYGDKKRALEEELNAEERAKQRVVQARLEFRWAKDGLTKAIHDAEAATRAAEDASCSLATAPPFEPIVSRVDSPDGVQDDVVHVDF